MGFEEAVSDAGPLIHLAQISKLELLEKIFGRILIPEKVRKEVIDRGKEKGLPNASVVEEAIKAGWIVIQEEIDDRIGKLAEQAGISEGETTAILLARERKCPVLLDDLAARRFAMGLGLKVIGSVGILIKATGEGLVGKAEALSALEKLAKVMWLSIDVYEQARKVIEES